MEIDYSSKDSHEHIKKQCEAARISRHNILSPDNVVNLVLRLTDTLVVKYGPGVRRGEACALQFATEHFDPSVVRVPTFVQFFTSGDGSRPTGYLVMAFVDGTTLDRNAGIDTAIAEKVLRAVAHVHSFTNAIPGPLDGSPARGLLWSEYDAGQSFDTVGKLQEYLDLRFIGGPSLIDVTCSTLHLCHMDIALRNMIVDEAGVICLLDWGCAGFYPSSFETWAMALEAHIRPHPVADYLASLSLEKATADERSQVSALNQVFAANQRFAFPNTRKQEESDSIMRAVFEQG